MHLFLSIYFDSKIDKKKKRIFSFKIKNNFYLHLHILESFLGYDWLHQRHYQHLVEVSLMYEQWLIEDPIDKNND